MDGATHNVLRQRRSRRNTPKFVGRPRHNLARRQVPPPQPVPTVPGSESNSAITVPGVPGAPDSDSDSGNEAAQPSPPGAVLPPGAVPPGVAPPPGAQVDSSDDGADSGNEQLQPAPLPPPGFPTNGAATQLGRQPVGQIPGALPFTTTLPGNPVQTGNLPPPQQPVPVNPDAGRRPPSNAERPLPGSMNTIPPVGAIPITVPPAPAPVQPPVPVQPPPQAQPPAPVQPVQPDQPVQPVQPPPQAQQPQQPPQQPQPVLPLPTASASLPIPSQPSAALPSAVQPPLAGIPGLTSIAREEVAPTPTGSTVAAPVVAPANTGGDSDRGIAVGITFGTLALIGILVAIGIFIFKKNSSKKADVEAAAPPPAPVAAPAPLAIPQTARAPRANNQTIIEAYGRDENDMEQMGYYNEKGFQKLPPLPQQGGDQDYGGEDDYNNNRNDNNSYMPGQGGLPVAQRDSDGRYLGR
ncbi:hypothetical protein BN1723_016266 [Verticillium longisporum]|uniref:Uncharacterized protein n=1 Tax=Verticillium longisporum TaxID=100787 RepID=A0A0G4KKH2_VERLO|nr:hypothetical protein HYQ44_019437 [Verticillium longisporum]CRK06936.1 hypothetical protein BN1708_009748 [Verticillium longisporum]CRK43858.1 hypothetical protein BN1723_016266 [Verticillium longisporum]